MINFERCFPLFLHIIDTEFDNLRLNICTPSDISKQWNWNYVIYYESGSIDGIDVDFWVLILCSSILSIEMNFWKKKGSAHHFIQSCNQLLISDGAHQISGGNNVFSRQLLLPPLSALWKMKYKKNQLFSTHFYSLGYGPVIINEILYHHVLLWWKFHWWFILKEIL